MEFWLGCLKNVSVASTEPVNIQREKEKYWEDDQGMYERGTSRRFCQLFMYLSK